MKISEAFDEYLDYVYLNNPNKNYTIHIKAAKRMFIQVCGDKDVCDIELKDIVDWYNFLKKGRSENTCRNYICLIRMLFKLLNEKNIPCLNYGLIPSPKRIPTTPCFIGAGDVTEMIRSSDNIRTKFIVSLLYSSGIRVSELLSLNRGQIKDRQFTVIGKGKKERICFIDYRTEELMNEYLSGRNDRCDALVVTRRNKNRPTAGTIQLIVKNAAEKAGLHNEKITPHTLRHSFATNYLKNNGGIRYLQEMLGHSSMTTTQLYTHVVDNDLKEKYDMYHTI